MRTNAQQQVRQLLGEAGIQINGPNSWDIQVRNESFYSRIIAEGSLGLGESYMEGWWDAETVNEFIFRILRSGIDRKVNPALKLLPLYLKSALLNMQSRARSKKVIREHYDLGNDLYEAFLDPYLQYTCAYFQGTEDLNVAQEQKMELICRKLQLKSTDHLLDIGCGFGGLAKYAAQRYGCQVTGVTLSGAHAHYARKFCAGLPVTILQQDYRDLSGQFSKIVSVGMFEHVGYKNHVRFFEIVDNCLEKDGLFLLHTLGNDRTTKYADPWTEKYIFPHCLAPSVHQLSSAFEGRFIMEDWHNFGAYYAPTVKAWWHNFNRNWNALRDKYGPKFYRMWKYYLLSCEGACRARQIQLWQIVFSRKGVLGGYTSIRKLKEQVAVSEPIPISNLPSPTSPATYLG